MKKLSVFEFLIDHRTDEVIETEILLGLASFVERCLRVGVALELGLETATEVLQEGTLFVGCRVGELIGIDEGCRTLGCFAKVLEMSQFVALRRSLEVVALAALKIHFDGTFFGEGAIRVMKMFLTRDEFVFAVQGTVCEVDAGFVRNLCHILN